MKNKMNSKIIKYIFLLFLFFIYICIYISNKILKNIIYNEEESTYFTTWATANEKLIDPPFDLSHNTIRQIVKVSAGGEKIRIKFSNILGESNIEIKQVSIADLISENEIDKKTMKFLTFNNGEEGAIIEGRKEIYSDTIFYPLKDLSYIAISIYFGSVPNKLTGHLLSLTFSYFEKGNKIKKNIFTNNKKKAHWYIITSIEISSNPPKKTIVCFGDSITDGVSQTFDARNNYPDILSKKLHENPETSNFAVINEGINGNRLITQGIKRFKHDVLDIKGISYLILLFGVNDIKGLDSKAEEIISVYNQIIEEAHNKNILVYGGTILPFALYLNGKAWNENREKERQKLNEWIRKTNSKNGGFDAFFDFDKELKDPKNKINLKKEYDCGDGIHPNLEGYTKIVECITKDLKLFTNKKESKLC